MIGGNEEALSILNDLARPEQERADAVDYLKRHADADAIAALVATLHEGDYGVRRSAAHALAEIGEPALRPLLRALASTGNDVNLRQAAWHILHHNSSPAVRNRSAALQAALQGPGAETYSMEEAFKLLQAWR
jgi:HEAT repeat protein